MYFPKTFALLTVLLVFMYTVGLLLFIYFQQGVDSAIHIGG